MSMDGTCNSCNVYYISKQMLDIVNICRWGLVATDWCWGPGEGDGVRGEGGEPSLGGDAASNSLLHQPHADNPIMHTITACCFAPIVLGLPPNW